MGRRSSGGNFVGLFIVIALALMICGGLDFFHACMLSIPIGMWFVFIACFVGIAVLRGLFRRR